MRRKNVQAGMPVLQREECTGRDARTTEVGRSSGVLECGSSKFEEVEENKNWI